MDSGDSQATQHSAHEDFTFIRFTLQFLVSVPAAAFCMACRLFCRAGDLSIKASERPAAVPVYLAAQIPQRSFVVSGKNAMPVAGIYRRSGTSLGIDYFGQVVRT